MPVIFDCRFLLVILSISCDLVDSIFDDFYGTSHSILGDISPRSNYSKMLTREILQIFSTLNENTFLPLELLYDHHYEDTVADITRSFKDMDGTMVFEYQKAITELHQLLIPVAGTPVLLLLCSTTHIVKIFEKVRDQRLESHVVLWFLVLEDEEKQDEVIFGLEGLIIEGTQVTLVTQGPLENFSVFSSRVDLDGVVRFFNMGNWNPNSDSKRSQLQDLVMSDVQSQYSDMKGRELILAANDIFPFFVKDKPSKDGIVRSASGVEPQIVRSLSTAFNFTFRIVSPADGSTGTALPDGSWTGLIGMLINREAHFALNVLGISGSREAVIDFTSSYYSEPLTIASRAPKLKNRAFAVLSPFTLQVWICIAVSTLALGPILKFQAMVMRTYLKKGNAPTWGLQVYSFSIFRNLILQGNVLDILQWPHRFMFYFWYIFCLMISASYSGMLTAVFAVPAYETTVDSLEDLPRAARDGFTLGVLKESTNEDLFKYAEEGIYKQTWDLFNHKDRSKSFILRPAQALAKVLKEKFVAILPQTHIKIITRLLGRSKFHVARQTFYPQGVGIACPTGAPYRETFSLQLLRLVETGIIPKWILDGIEKFGKRFSAEERSSNSQAITLTHLQAAFFVLMLGYMVSIVTLTIENVHSSYQRINRVKESRECATIAT